MSDVYLLTLLIGLGLLALAMRDDGEREEKALSDPADRMTPREQEAFHHLCELFPNHHIVAQISNRAILHSDDESAQPKNGRLASAIERKSVEFAVQSSRGETELLIQIGDWGDRALPYGNRLSDHAGCPIIRHPASSKVDRASLAMTIQQAFAHAA